MEAPKAIPSLMSIALENPVKQPPPKTHPSITSRKVVIEDKEIASLKAFSPSREIRSDSPGHPYPRGGPSQRLKEEETNGFKYDSPSPVVASRSPYRQDQRVASPAGRGREINVDLRQRLRTESPQSQRNGSSYSSSSPSSRPSIRQRMSKVIRNVEINDFETGLENIRSLPYKMHGEFVFEMANSAVELCFRTRRKIGKFFFCLVEREVVDGRDMRQGLQRFIEISEDVEIDVPRLWFNFGQLCAPLISNDTVFPFRQMEFVCQRLDNREKSHTCVRELLKEATHIMTKKQVLDFWHFSSLAQESISKSALFDE